MTAVLEAQELGKSYELWRSPQARLSGGLWRRAAALPLLPEAARRRCEQRAAGASTPFAALSDVSFQLAQGDTLAVIGRNGSGKSTLLQLLAGTLGPSRGRVQLRGRVAALLELGSGFHPDFSGRENVRLQAATLGLTAEEVEARLPEMAAFADVGMFLDQPLRTYSSGMVLRLAFAVAAHARPDVLIVDEVLAVGDAGFQFKCLAHMRGLVESGTTLVLVSHDMYTVRAFCRQALYLEAGRVKAQGPTEEVAELYFRDLRDDQRRSAGAAPLESRPSLGGGAPAFGSPDGRICDVRFERGAGRQLSVARGEPLALVAELELGASLRAPFASLLLLSEQLIPVAGRSLRLLADGRPQRVELRFAFRASLNPGRYFLTLRLEDGVSPQSALLVEKQAAALRLDVADEPGAELLGFFDLGIEAACVEQQAPSLTAP